MSKKTVDFGIDLGTTNSAIARMTAKGCEVIPVQRQNYIPSAVARTKRGDLKVGADALRADFVPIAKQFKRLMGTSEQLELADGSKMSPVELSAEILKALRAAVKLRTNEDLKNVVITVPAMFNQPQCEATIQAAELAGLNAVALLQEPIAAATAFLSDHPVEGNYLVYDLGGGTFDVSVVRLRSGEMQVLGHGGDNYLGGSDLDKAVYKWLLDKLHTLATDQAQFSTPTGIYEATNACEKTKIELSDVESSPIYLDGFPDLPISKLELTREQLELLLEDFVTRSIGVSRDRLKDLELDANDVKAILLVGGPTQTPYIRQRLSAELGIPLNFEQDPMTVVAQGAAMHASTLLAETRTENELSTGSVELDLHYDPVTNDSSVTLAGRVERPKNFKGEVRIKSTSGDFDTGWIMLVNSSFATDIILSKQAVTTFSISVQDLIGTQVECDPAVITVRHGVRSAQPVVPYNVGVAKRGGLIGTVVKAGDELPAHGEADFQLAETLQAGSPSLLTIYIVESPGTHTDDALLVGKLQITGSEISRTIKAGEKISVRIRIDENRQVKARVYIPLIDEEWETASYPKIDEPNVEDVNLSLMNLRSTINEIQSHIPESEHDKLLRAEREIERYEALIEEYEDGNQASGYQVHKQLLDTQALMRPLHEKYGKVALHQEITERANSAEALCDEFKDTLGIAKLADLRKDLDKALKLDDRTALESVKERVRGIFWEHYGKTRACAEYQIQWMREASPQASDALSYHELVKRAERALTEDDRKGVLLYASRAWDFLPDRERAKNRYHDSGI